MIRDEERTRPGGLSTDAAAEPDASSRPEVVARWTSPAPCPSRLLVAADPGERPFVLRSGRGAPQLSRWSYGALEAVGHCRDLTEASRAARALAPALGPGLPPFCGGAVGYVSYDVGFADQWSRVGRKRSARPSPLGLEPVVFGLYDAVYAKDELTGEGVVVAQPTDAALARARRLVAILKTPRSSQTGGLSQAMAPLVDHRTHLKRIRRALGLIAEGEIYQVNLVSLRGGRYRGEPSASFLRLLDQGAPPFSAFLGLGHGKAVISASPECFLNIDERTGRASTYPIKGTRPRSRVAAEDMALAEALRSSPKDCAEHTMIVDLMRNDLGRSALIGSVHVDAFRYLESFPGIHHLTSEVSATMAPGSSAEAVFRSMFPGGSITGVPKLRAMEIIEDLEGAPRGLSTGSILYLGPSGLRASVAIRTAEIHGQDVCFAVGGGIVADSDPELEWAEAETKAEALTRALREPCGFL